jgi:beta-phosphoglucomutase-like phosphatase (HAD superfamily)
MIYGAEASQDSREDPYAFLARVAKRRGGGDLLRGLLGVPWDSFFEKTVNFNVRIDKMVNKKIIPAEGVELIVDPASLKRPVPMSRKEGREVIADTGGRPKRVQTPAQLAAFEKARAKRAELLEAKKAAAAESAAEAKRQLEEDLSSGRKIKLTVRPSNKALKAKRDAVKVSSESDEPEGSYQAKPLPKPKLRRQPEVVESEDKGDDIDETELDTDLPSEFDDAPKKVRVPRKVKEAVHKVKAINKAITIARASGPSGFSIFGY